MPKVKSPVGQKIAEGRERVSNAITNVKVVPAVKARTLTFVSNFRKLTNPWLLFISKLGDLKVGEALALDLSAPPSGLVKAAETAEVDLEYALDAGKLHVRIAPSAIDVDMDEAA